jgi:ATP-dependent RNA circularization protein (DNA/RNA ligase family)
MDLTRYRIPKGDHSMSELTVDLATSTKLRQVRERVEIRDQAGELIGYFMPRVDRLLYESVEIPISEEELRRRAQKGGGRTLVEILADLERRV